MTPTETFADVPIDRVQDYWDARPCNIRHSAQPVGTVEYFAEVEARKYFVEPHIPVFADFPRWAGMRVLEIGCGIGTDTMNFARHGAHVTAVDVSERSLEVARQRARVLGLEDSIRFVHGDAEVLDRQLGDERFDLVYSFGVIHHSPHPERILDQIARYVRPGGTVKLMVYHRYSWKVFWIVLTAGKGRFWRLGELVARHSEAQTGCPVTFTYSRGGLRQIMERRGLHVRDVRVDHIFPYRVDDYVRYRYRKVWYFAILPTPIFRGLERVLGWHLCISAVAE